MTFPWVVFLIMKSKIYSYIEKGDILLKIRPHCWCTATLCFTLHFELKLLKRWVVSLTDELLLIIMSSTFYSILKLTLTHYLVSLWMQRFTQFWGRRGGGGSQLDFFGGAAMVTRLTRVIAGTRGVYCILNTNACSFPYLVESVENSLIQL